MIYNIEDMQECMGYKTRCLHCGSMITMSTYRVKNNYINNIQCKFCGYTGEEIRDLDCYE